MGTGRTAEKRICQWRTMTNARNPLFAVVLDLTPSYPLNPSLFSFLFFFVVPVCSFASLLFVIFLSFLSSSCLCRYSRPSCLFCLLLSRSAKLNVHLLSYIQFLSTQRTLHQLSSFLGSISETRTRRSSSTEWTIWSNAGVIFSKEWLPHVTTMLFMLAARAANPSVGLSPM